ncbi:pyruvate formate-lyase-activating protein [Marinisporobacter balticus]|uniref:Pyruvate formate-lyase-activating enzyme n=1 Tax=Marinisporobacter balticus TaxID=2018667 RepID=A0A4R2KD04_9FIRM|nr:pyruvate formate-lyase-activating protein [Marinisporobacter balticus]TCO70172.1 pyruvate formate lyase activating enzyme [Marinisporobacter balticus]
MIGKIHSCESMGLTDGPGIRFVTFFQGCKLRCAYCHNPDTWDFYKGETFTSKELLKKVLRFKPYFEKSGGGVTCSGGEPLMQAEFLIEFLKLCKENGIHTAIDTAGFGKGSYEEILKYTDLVILDIKHINGVGYRKLTGGNISSFEIFKKAIIDANMKLWIRHVMVPGITDSKEHLASLKKIIKGFKNVEKIELLPYHNLGENKYKAMGIPYKLEGIKPMSREKTVELEAYLNNI